MNSKEMLAAAGVDIHAVSNSYSEGSSGWKSVETPWDIIGKYFAKGYLQRLVEHQIETFDDFTNIQIEKTINMFNPAEIASDNDFDKESGKYKLEVHITFKNFKIYQPQIHENNGAAKLMFPQAARKRSFTYSSSMTVDLHIQYVIRNGEGLSNTQIHNKIIENVHIGKLPIMLRSSICVLSQYKHLNNRQTGECEYDAGGYFIINGSEKTVLGQERAAENKIYCFFLPKSTKWSIQAEIKSVPDYKSISPKQFSIMINKKNNGYGFGLFVQLPRLKTHIPLFVLFRAMGIISDKEICKYIVNNLNQERSEIVQEYLKASIIDGSNYMTQEDAMTHIVSVVLYTPIGMDKEKGDRKKREYADDIINNDIFPHCRTERQKIFFMGYMASRLIQCSLGWIEQTDRDSYVNKRIDSTGTLLNNLFRNYFNKVVKDMQKQIVREINNGSWRSTNDFGEIVNSTNIYKIIKPNTIENGIKRALATGDFGLKQINNNKVGVAQVLNRLTYISSLSHLRRVNTPIDKSGKLVQPRKLHNSSWGFLCPAETPEGGSVGVVKNMSYLTHITIPVLSAALYEYVKPYVKLVDDCTVDEVVGKVKVFINGNWIGISEEPIKFYTEIKEMKHAGIINIYTSIIFDYRYKEIRICNDSGRLTRPLIKVNKNKMNITHDIIKRLRNNELEWNDLLLKMKISDSIIEYIDAEEQNYSMIAMTPKRITSEYNFTHCEIHPSTIFGILASCIPFPEHNQSPRNTYQCAMGKQAMGVYVTNYDSRLDKTAFVLNYPMRPLVDTRIMGLINLHKIPSGCPVIVAIMTQTGYNQEDSIMFNKGAIDRGLFQATIYHTEKDEDKKINGDEEIRCKPDKTKTNSIKFGNYDKLTPDGVIPENTKLDNMDIILGKVVPIKENRNDPTKVIKYTDYSRSIRTTEEMYVDQNYMDRNGDGYNFAKVRLRTMRRPVIGDKFSSRHGQKGTIGNIIPEQDMPFTKNGLKPDIIINPHAIPSRMTIAQLKETLLGKILLELGLFGDGTSFGDLDINDISKELLNIGYEQHGNEIMYNGLTGEQITTEIFIGPVFYQRLKHMVNDKTHSRSIGPKVNFTRQPAEGRSRAGGLRFGEMERDCMISHGASRFTKGRVYDASDSFSVHVCKQCGMIASYNDEQHIHMCKTCGNRIDFAYVEIPYACKLLFQELLTMNVAPRMIVQD